MTQKQYDIKCNGWHKVNLNGDILTGDTFKVKEFIKRYLGGKWDAESKGWRVDLDAVKKYATGSTIMVR
jgi:hypothetical protein